MSKFKFLASFFIIIIVLANTMGSHSPFKEEKVEAAAKQTISQFRITVLDGDWLDSSKKPAGMSGLTVKTLDQGGNVYDAGVVYEGNGVYTSSSNLVPGTYKVQFTGGKNTVAAPVTVKTGNAPTSLTVKFYSDSFDATKTGAIKDIVRSQYGDPLPEVTVRAISPKLTYETITDAKGQFTLLVPPGAYDLIIVGKEQNANQDRKKNTVYKKISVVKGQASSPIEELVGDLAWTSGDNTQGLEVEEPIAGDTVIKGVTLSQNAVINVYEERPEGKVYIASGKTTASKQSSAASFNVKLPRSFPGSTLVVEVVDEAQNAYSTEVSFDMAVINFAADDTDNTIGKALDLTFDDKTNTVASTPYLKVWFNKEGESERLLVKTTDPKAPADYTVAKGKLTISPQLFMKSGYYEGSYEFKIEVKGYDVNPEPLTQEIKSSVLAASSIAGAKLEKGNTAGEVKITGASLQAGNHSEYEIVEANSAEVLPKYGEVVPVKSGLQSYNLGAEISGITPIKNTIVIYELNSDRRLVKVSVLKATSSVISLTGVSSSKPVAGSAQDTVNFTVTPPASGKIKYLESYKKPSTPIWGSNVSANAKEFTGQEITVVYPQKFLALYQVDEQDHIVGFGVVDIGSVVDYSTPEVPYGIEQGSKVGKTKVTFKEKPISGNTFKYKIATTIPNSEVKQSVPGLKSISSVSEIAATENYWLGLYEVDSQGKVVKFSRVQLTSDLIKK
ncbi:hemoblobin-interacting domain-containing protein [Peribacillus deserti]|uniref:Uncharacterized protein n=1 Tax=Peribacillus deserti TaxID=673318 RepID=A0A2N5M9Q3_9BACI|nr:carboxypeptidase regulatory-like domain-containing protein [Peribacillus deserti]PLT31077.1 hypothetical protein CUU66_04565 [Peribacillus deserti]